MSVSKTFVPFIIGVAGGSGSGKTSISQQIQEMVGAENIAYLQHISYYRDHSHHPVAERARVNYDHPDSLDTELLLQHLHALCNGQAIDVPKYDFALHTRLAETRLIQPARIVLVEGILILVEKELRDMMDLRIYVDTDADLRFIRRLQRDMSERGRTLDLVVQQYMTTVRPMHQEFVEPSRRYAHVIIPEGGENRVAIKMIVSQVQEVLAQKF
jgi:uridine kinase